MEATVTVKKGCWSAGSEEDEVSFETLLIDDRSAFERGEDGAFGLRETKAGFDQRVDHECCIDRYQELFKAGVLKRGDENRFAFAREVDEFLGWDEIGLVQNLDDGLGGDGKLGQDLFNLSFLLFTDRAGGVLDVEKNLGSLNLFKRGTEARNERVGKVADEANRIGE
jgi:hypothetical protein